MSATTEPTTGIPLELLKKFCSTDETRPSIMEPIHVGGMVYATSGHILVRTSSTFPETYAESVPPKMVEQLPQLLADFPSSDSGEWTHSIPEGTPKTEACEVCGGSGKPQECPSCDGQGEVELDHSWQDHNEKWHNDKYDCECSHCEGSGRLGGEGEDCEECSGKGVVEASTPVKFADYAWIDALLLKEIRQLPGLEIHPRPDRAAFKAVPIRGTGWIGLVMPTRSPEERL